MKPEQFLKKLWVLYNKIILHVAIDVVTAIGFGGKEVLSLETKHQPILGAGHDLFKTVAIRLRKSIQNCMHSVGNDTNFYFIPVSRVTRVNSSVSHVKQMLTIRKSAE